MAASPVSVMPLRCRPTSTRLIWSGVRLCSLPHRDQRIERGVGVAATRIRLYADLHGLVDLAEPGGRLVGMRVVAVADQQAVLAFDQLGRADEFVARQGRGDHAVHGGGADLVALVPGAIDQKLQRARGLAAGDAECRNDLRLRKPEQFSGGRRRAIGAGSRGRMKTLLVMRGRIERIAEPAADFIARDDRGQHLAAGGTDHFADRECRRHHGRARVQRGVRMRIVEIEGMAERAVEQRRHRRRPGLGVAEHGGFALAVERQRFQHPKQRGGGFRIAPRPDRAAEEIQRQHLGALQYLRRNILEFQVGDIGGERCGFVGHRVPSFWRAGYAGKFDLSSRLPVAGISYAQRPASGVVPNAVNHGPV